MGVYVHNFDFSSQKVARNEKEDSRVVVNQVDMRVITELSPNTGV